MKYDYVTYRHREGFGRTDHLADEIIVRAARILGLCGDRPVAEAAGFASHAVGQTHAVRLRGADAKKRMRAALRAARAEMPCRTDCRIDVVGVTTVIDDREVVDGRMAAANIRTYHDGTLHSVRRLTR